MTHAEFSDAARKIARFLGAASLSTDRISAWFEKVAHIPGEALPWIVGKITAEADAMPRNLPKAFLEKFSLWLSEHPDKQARAPENHGCPDCENGILWLERQDERGKLETACVFCRCYQGSTGNVGRFSLREVQTRGWQSRTRAVLGAGPTSPETHNEILSHLAGARAAERQMDPLRHDAYAEQWEEVV